MDNYKIVEVNII